MNAATSLPRKVSPSPTPSTSGELRRAATTTSGCSASTRTRVNAPCRRRHTARSASASDPPCAVRWRGDEVGDGLAVGVADEFGAGRLELGAQRAEVLDDAVVHDRDAPARVGVRVGVAVVRRAVGGPAGVAHAGGAGQHPGRDLGRDLLVQVLDPARLLGDLQPGVADDRDAGGVVPAVLQPAQTLDDDVQRRARPDVTHDAAHGQQPNRGWTDCRSATASPWSGVPVSAGVVGAGVVGVEVAGVVVTAGAVWVTVGVVTTTFGVTVTVTVGAGGVTVVVRAVPPNSVVPEPESPRTRSVTGRPARASTPVTIASTTAKIAAAANPTRRQARATAVGGPGAGSCRSGSVGGSGSATPVPRGQHDGRRRRVGPQGGDGVADPVAGGAQRLAVDGVADGGRDAGDGGADDRAADAEVGGEERGRRRGERGGDQLGGRQVEARQSAPGRDGAGRVGFLVGVGRSVSWTAALREVICRPACHHRKRFRQSGSPPSKRVRDGGSSG